MRQHADIQPGSAYIKPWDRSPKKTFYLIIFPTIHSAHSIQFSILLPIRTGWPHNKTISHTYLP